MLTVSNYGKNKAGVKSTMQVLSSWGKPVVLTEFGVRAKDRYTGKTISDSARATWIRDAYNWMVRWNSAHPVKIEAAMYFNHSPGGGPYPRDKAKTTFPATTR